MLRRKVLSGWTFPSKHSHNTVTREESQFRYFIEGGNQKGRQRSKTNIGYFGILILRIRHEMITSSEMEQRRSPAALREFVIRFKEMVRADEFERHRGIQKKGLYKQFLDEIVPLSCFAVLAYPESHEVQMILGNQRYDALVFSESGAEVDRVEITAPHDGAAAAMDAKQVVSLGYGQIHCGSPGSDFAALFPHVLASCRKKARKDYSDCTLVVAIEPMVPFASFKVKYEKQMEALASEISQIEFKAKRVFLLILPDRLVRIYG